MSTSANLYGVAVGTASTGALGLSPIVTVRAPATTDIRGPNGPFRIGQNWVDSTNNAAYELTSFTSSNGATTATWVALGGGTSAVATLTGDTGTATPSGGNIQIAGTTNQISTVGSGATITLSLTGPYTPATYTAHGVLLGEGTGSIVATTAGATGQTLMGSTGADPAFTSSPSFAGSVTAATTVTATLGNITATNGNLVMSTAGNKVVVPTGANASAGTSGVMAGTPGSVTVATTASSATAKVFYARATAGGTLGNVSISAQDGTGFTLLSTGNESSTFNWWIINL